MNANATARADALRIIIFFMCVPFYGTQEHAKEHVPVYISQLLDSDFIRNIFQAIYLPMPVADVLDVAVWMPVCPAWI